MPIQFAVQPFSLPTAGMVSLEVVSINPPLKYFVTAQPLYWTDKDGTLQNPYTAIAVAGVKSVLCVRDSSEIVYQPNPFDLTESGQLIINGVAYTNVSMPHYIPSSPTPGAPNKEMTQTQFDAQAYNAATVIVNGTQPLLVHCSTGDRASATFAVYLIQYCGYSNAEALDFATTKLVLQNASFKQYVQRYRKPGS